MGEQKNNKDILTRFVIGLATLFGVGSLPVLQGTAGSVVGAGFIFLFVSSSMNPAVFFLLSVIICLASFPVSGRAEKFFRQKDCKKIVIDDFSGMLISFSFLPKTTGYVLAAFLLFRFFDFFKVYPANRLEKVPGGVGVVGDDLCAGIYTCVCLHLFRLAVNIFS